MTDWIANGEPGSSVRPKLNALEHPIASPASITDPVLWLDFTIPSDSFEVRISIQGLRMVTGSGADSMDFAVSTDGETFLNDTENFDSYSIASMARGSGSASQPAKAFSGADGLGYLTWNSVDENIPMDMEIVINPGGNGDGALITTEARITSILGPEISFAWSRLLDTTDRITTLRILPGYGNGDANPPTKGNTFTAGRYRVFGVG